MYNAFALLLLHISTLTRPGVVFSNKGAALKIVRLARASPMSNRNNKILLFFTGLVPAILPFVFVTVTLDPVRAPALMAIALVLSAFYLFWPVKYGPEEQVIVSPSYLTVWGIFLMLNVASLFYTSDVSGNYFEIARITLWILLLLAFSIVFQQDKDGIKAFCRGVVVAAFVECIIGVIQIANFMPAILRHTEYTYFITGTLAHKNLFSSGLMLMLPLTAYCCLRDNNRFWKYSSAICIQLIIVDLAIVQTRAVWVGLTIALICSLILLCCFLIRQQTFSIAAFIRKYLPYFLAFAVVSSLLLYKFGNFNPHDNGTVIGRIYSTIHYNGEKTQSNETVRERFFLWYNSLQMWRDAPVFGRGTASWQILYPSYGLKNTRSEQGYVHFQRPHNDFLWVLSENGVVGFTVYLLLFIIPLFWLARRVLTGSMQSVALPLLIFFGVISWMGDAFFCFPSERNTHVFLLISFFAIAMSGTEVKGVNIVPLHKFIAPVALILLVPVIIVADKRISGEYHTRLVQMHLARMEYRLALDEAKAARSFVYEIDPVSAPLKWYEGVAWYSLDDMPKALACFQESYRLHPYHLPTLNNMASCYVKLNQPDSAFLFYRKALDMAPKFQESLLNLSAVYFNLHQIDSAYAIIGRCDPSIKQFDYNQKLGAILRVKTQLLINSGYLTEPQKQQALIWKNDFPMLKSIYTSALANQRSFSEEMCLRF